jgi:hypothetical protein
MTPKSIDHYVLMVHDQEAAREAYLRLGFNVRPTARHIELGSSNAVVIFPKTYLELIHLSDAMESLRAQYVARFDAGPGLAHVSLTADSLAAEHERLTSLGFQPGQPLNARRKVILPDGSEGETDSSSMYNWKPERRFLSLFYSEHRKPETIFIEGHTHHPNGALDTAAIVAVSEAPAEDLPYYEASWGQAAETSGPDGFLMRGARGDRMEVLTPDAARARYGALLDGLDLAGLGGLPVALHLTCRDRAETAAFLAAAGVGTVDLGTGIAVAPAEAEGVILVFE